MDYTKRYILQATVIHCALTQLSMKRRLKKFKQKGKILVTVELEQLQRRHAFRPEITDNLTEKHKHESLALVMFLKEKRDGSIKGSGVADRIKQRDKI